MAGDIRVREQVILADPEAKVTKEGLSLALESTPARVLHRFGQRVLITEVPEGSDDIARGRVRERMASVELRASTADAIEAATPDLDPVGAIGLQALQLRESREYAEAKASRAYDGESWDHSETSIPDLTPEEEADADEPVGLALAQAPTATSARMIGEIAVGIIIVEGPTADLKFSNAERTKVVAEVQNGLGWLATQHAAAGVSWTYDVKIVSLNVAPGPSSLGFSQKESLWRDPGMQQLGYATGMAGVESYVQDLRSSLGTLWGYVGFFTKYPLGHFAYASLGGPRLVMAYANDGWGPDNIDRVFAHESGHIFNAPDEYASSGCNCGGQWGYFKTPNKNCANCAPSGGVACIMKSNSWEMCDYTPAHFGWGAFESNLDAALWRNSNGKIYLFSNGYYVRYSSVSAGVDSGYPKPIKGNWPGLPNSFNNGIDAALMRESNGKIYFFKGDEYVRFTKVTDGIDPGYPKPIKGNWPGLPDSFNNGIDAAFWRRSNGKIYFFKGNRYVRFTKVSDGIDSGYPRPIQGNWPGLPPAFNSGIGAALMRKSNGKIYFFRNREYIRYSSVANGIDAGYPKPINGNWLPFPE